MTSETAAEDSVHTSRSGLAAAQGISSSALAKVSTWLTPFVLVALLTAGSPISAYGNDGADDTVDTDTADAVDAVEAVDDSLQDIDSGPTVNDPIEPFNRAMFSFNDGVDTYVLEPVARGWDFIAPDAVQASVSNFFRNLNFPVVAANNLLQGKPLDAASDVGRFLVNTTIGVAGFFDPATHFGLEQHNEDFGQTLGVWGVPPGPYLMIPLLGPSTIRDGTGRVVDSAGTVYSWYLDFPLSFVIPLAVTTTDTINFRAQSLHEIATAKESAFDYYVFVRNAYLQRRQALVEDSVLGPVEAPELEEDDLYFGDFEDDEPTPN